MDAPNLTLPLAFLAGLLSFVSPCVLPLVPAYIGYLGGTAVIAGQQDEAQSEGLRTFLHSLFFVLGFSLVFVVLGASATLIGRLLLDYSVALQRVGGVLLIVFGMRLMGTTWSRGRWIAAAALAGLATFILSSGLLTQGAIEFGEYSLTWLAESLTVGLVVLSGAGWDTTRQVILAVAAGALNFVASYDTLLPNLVASILISAVTVFGNRADLFYSEKKLELKRTERTGYLRSTLFGVVFAAGWTPCIGPILAGILLVASQLGTVMEGILLLLAYSLGLGIPFLVVGLAFGPLSRWLRKANRYLGVVSVISGVLLVLMGILIFTDSLTFLARYGSLIELGL
ncbi:cytochrome c biogenesis CcdA family protein [Chloroflexota bacterium]